MLLWVSLCCLVYAYLCAAKLSSSELGKGETFVDSWPDFVSRIRSEEDHSNDDDDDDTVLRTPSSFPLPDIERCLIFTENLRKEETAAAEGVIRETRAIKDELTLPDAVIIGAKKSGTRALLEFLKLNPAISGPGKEVHYFDRHFDKGVHWYSKKFKKHSQRQGVTLLIEKSPSYLRDSYTPQRIKGLYEHVGVTLPKFILTMREPVDRAVSDFTQSMTKSRRRNAQKTRFGKIKNGTDLTLSERIFRRRMYKSYLENKEEIENIGESILNGSFDYLNTNKMEKLNNVINSKWPVIDGGMYAKYLDNWLKVFDNKSIIFVNADADLRYHNPALILQKIEAELLPKRKPTIREEMFYFDDKKRFYCISDSATKLRWPDREKSDAKRRGKCLGETKGRKHVKVRDIDMAMLRAYFVPHNRRLFEIIGKVLW